MLHLDYRTDLRRHGDAPAFLAFQVEALKRVVHSSNYNLLLKLDDAHWLRFNCDFSLRDLAIADLVDAPISASYENAVVDIISTISNNEDRRRLKAELCFDFLSGWLKDD